MRRFGRAGIMVATLVLAAGCAPGRPGGPEQSVPTARLSSPAGDTPTVPLESGISSAPPETPGSSSPSVSASVDTWSTTTRTPRSITVGGPTLDNRYPEVLWVFQKAGTKCYWYVNSSAEVQWPVTVERMWVTGDQAPRGFGLSAAFPSSGATPCGRRGPVASFSTMNVLGPCVGATLPPAEGTPPSADGNSYPAACAILVRFSGTAAKNYRGTVNTTHAVRCTSAAGPPCATAAVRALQPSPANPVTVRWVGSLTFVACLATPRIPGGGYSPGELDRSCADPAPAASSSASGQGGDSPPTSPASPATTAVSTTAVSTTAGTAGDPSAR